MPRRHERRVDPYPGPDAVWLFLQRNRRPLAILAGGILLVGAIWVFATYWQGGGCGGSETDRAVVADLGNDPLLAALPAGSTPTHETTSYLSCQQPAAATTRQAARTSLPIAVQIVREYQLANPMTVVELHDHQVASVGRGEWRLSHTDAHSLSYCRLLRGYRVVSLMALDDRRLTIQTIVWTDGAGCSPEVHIPAPPPPAR